MADLNLPSWARELVESARVAHLGLLDGEGHPRVLPVTFAVAEASVWTAVDDKPKRVPGRELARVRWLRTHPQASLVVDHYSDDWNALSWVQLLGRVSILDDARPPAVLIEKYAAYRRRPPAGPLLRLDVERVLHWRAGPDTSLRATGG